MMQALSPYLPEEQGVAMLYGVLRSDRGAVDGHARYARVIS